MTPCEMRGGKRKMGHWTILLEESCFQIWTVCFCRTLLQSELHGFFLCAVSLKSTWHKLTKWDLQWPTVFFFCFVLFCFVSATCESSRNLHCWHQGAATSGRRKLCVSAQLAPVAPCLWGTSWVSERMNWVSGAMNDEKPTAVMLPLNLALSLSPPSLCFVLPLYIRVSDSYVLTYPLKSLRGFTRAQKGLLISNDGCQNYGKFMAWSRLFVYLSRVHTLTSWCGIFHLVI